MNIDIKRKGGKRRYMQQAMGRATLQSKLLLNSPLAVPGHVQPV